MENFEYKDYFDSRCCFSGDEDKVVAILDSYAQNQIDLSDINCVFELYHTKMFFEQVKGIPNWSEAKYQSYKVKTEKLKDVVYAFFKNITENNVVDIYNECYVAYRDDFRKFFFMYKTYTCISKQKIVDILKNLNWNPFQILEDKGFVEYFDGEITELLMDETYGLSFVVSYYLEEHDRKPSIYVPKSFTVEKRQKLVKNYLLSDHVRPNDLQLIINARSTKELPITPKMKKMADQKNTEFWENNKSVFSHQYGFCVSFGPYKNEKHLKREGEVWHLEYGIDWIKDNTDFPTLLNNFVYLFEYTDAQMRFTITPNNSDKSSLLELIAVKGKGMYKKSPGFNMLEQLSDMQMSGYVYELNKLGINIEDLIKWFFEEYLFSEFNIADFTCNMPAPTDSILSKCKVLASAIDGVLSKYKMVCEDGEIDTDLFRYMTDSPRIKDVPSRIKNKYCYVVDPNISNEMNMLFSPQSRLKYTEKIGAKYSSFFDLIQNESITLLDCHPYNRKSINWLIQRETIFIENEIIKYNPERVYLLKEFYNKEVISLHHIKSSVLKKMIKNGDVKTDSSLFTKPESQYLDYLLNNSEFSDGRAIRNSYIHDAIVPDNETMKADYFTLLKIMILVIIKINDDCCIYEQVKEEGDFYDLKNPVIYQRRTGDELPFSC